MKYYCRNCKAEFASDREPFRNKCPFCGAKDSFGAVPAYESVLHWQERTGEKYPVGAPVWCGENCDKFCVFTEFGSNIDHEYCLVTNERIADMKKCPQLGKTK